MTFSETSFLLSTMNNRHSSVRANGVRFWGYPSRNAPVTCIGIHTTENTLGTPAMNVARWQASTAPTPSSYHALVDASNIVRTTRDEHTAFHIVGLNSRSLGLSFTHQAHRWSASPNSQERDMLERGAQVAREWVEKYDIPIRWISLAEAQRGVKGFIRHSTADPSRRSDPGQNFPHALFFELIEGETFDEDRPYVTTGDDDPRAKIWKELASELLPNSPNAFRSPDGRFGPQTVRLTLEAFEVLGLSASDPSAPRVGPRSVQAARDELERRSRNPYEGKRLVAIADTVNFYNTPRWTNPTGNFRQGQGFPVVEGITTSGTSQWYRVRNSAGAGPFYITTRSDLVELR